MRNTSLFALVMISAQAFVVAGCSAEALDAAPGDEVARSEDDLSVDGYDISIQKAQSSLWRLKCVYTAPSSRAGEMRALRSGRSYNMAHRTDAVLPRKPMRFRNDTGAPLPIETAELRDLDVSPWVSWGPTTKRVLAPGEVLTVRSPSRPLDTFVLDSPRDRSANIFRTNRFEFEASTNGETLDPDPR